MIPYIRVARYYRCLMPYIDIAAISLRCLRVRSFATCSLLFFTTSPIARLFCSCLFAATSLLLLFCLFFHLFFVHYFAHTPYYISDALMFDAIICLFYDYTILCRADDDFHAIWYVLFAGAICLQKSLVSRWCQMPWCSDVSERWCAPDLLFWYTRICHDDIDAPRFCAISLRYAQPARCARFICAANAVVPHVVSQENARAALQRGAAPARREARQECAPRCVESCRARSDAADVRRARIEFTCCAVYRDAAWCRRCLLSSSFCRLMFCHYLCLCLPCVAPLLAIIMLSFDTICSCPYARRRCLRARALSPFTHDATFYICRYCPPHSAALRPPCARDILRDVTDDVTRLFRDMFYAPLLRSDDSMLPPCRRCWYYAPIRYHMPRFFRVAAMLLCLYSASLPLLCLRWFSEPWYVHAMPFRVSPTYDAIWCCHPIYWCYCRYYYFIIISWRHVARLSPPGACFFLMICHVVFLACAAYDMRLLPLVYASSCRPRYICLLCCILRWRVIITVSSARLYCFYYFSKISCALRCWYCLWCLF